MKRLSKDEGVYLVRLAREAVEKYIMELRRIEAPKDAPARLYEKRGVFVTIETLVKDAEGVLRRELRGCIGYPLPTYPLIEATISAAIAAATEDPRFPPMSYDELDRVVFEVSVLSQMEEIKYNSPNELPKKIRVGRDGLMVEKGLMKGLLLPQVPVEYGWNEEEFLSQVCFKAGLSFDAWRRGGVRIYRFEAQIFAEIFPRGEVIERILMLGNER